MTFTQLPTLTAFEEKYVTNCFNNEFFQRGLQFNSPLICKLYNNGVSRIMRVLHIHYGFEQERKEKLGCI